jgi:transglutaminase-like putative cysteine protease
VFICGSNEFLMYDIRQFKPSLYLLLILGMSGFALAAQSPGLWLLAVAGIALNAWLVFADRFRPLPHLLASAVTLGSMLYVAILVLRAGTTPILLIGEFLVFLQLVKLYEQRSNRDYAQLLVLSLLLMVAASINTASLLFGLMLIVYLFLSLYCCLLFHLKVEADHARRAISIPDDKINPATLRQDQRFLTRSMRRLTGLISLAAIAMAIIVFLFFPRWPGSTLLGPLQFRASQTLTGFSESVSFEQVARITQNDSVVAHVRLEHNGKPVEGARTLLLRGITLDRYNGSGRNGGAAWSWDRSQIGDVIYPADEGATTGIIETESSDEWVQRVDLYATGSTVLFAMPGVTSFSPARKVILHYSAGDETIQNQEPVIQPLSYEVTSRGYVGLSDKRKDRLVRESSGSPRGLLESLKNMTPMRVSEIDPAIRGFARNPDVSGANANGPLWQQRPALATTALDNEIATRIEQYLRTKYEYTLDLTDVSRISDQDPIVGFLTDFKRGHCEYFAGAMTLLCQSLGMQARMVVGFKCDDYNSLGGYYIVRQNHAHAWVEVRLPDGTWATYDPTGGREANRRNAGILGTLKHAFDYLEYTWANNVIAYDRGRRDNVVQNVETQLTTTAITTSDALIKARAWLNERQRALEYWLFASERWTGTYYILRALTALMLLSLLGAIGWFLYERSRLRRRAVRIGIGDLPPGEKLRLARQLGFYDDLLRLLEKHGIARAAHLTPLEFSESLSFLPAQAYDAIRRLTRVFYKIRYGGLNLATAHQRRLGAILTRLEDSLPTPRKRLI